MAGVSDSDDKRLKRNFDKRGIVSNDGKMKTHLSTNLPKPNILRVEVLDGNARQRYLQSIQRVGDRIRNSTYQQISKPGERVFYGFMTSGGETGFDLNVDWSDKAASGTLLGELKGIAGVIPGVGDVVGGVSDAIEGIGDIAGSILGINATTTGSGTVKDFAGVSLRDYHIKCGWYLPEQYDLCTKSLKTIYRMAYPKQLGSERLADITEAIANGVNEELGRQAAQNEGVKNVFVSAAQSAAEVTATATKTSAPLVQAIGNIREAFGANYTFNPLPVRVSVGQHMDIEPLVITGVNTSFSKETFINYSGSKNDKGRHLPIFVYTTISFKYWLNPAPNLEFTSLLGEELFGVNPVPKPKTYSTGKYDPNGKTVQDVIEENNMTRSYMDNTVRNIGRYGNSPLKRY